mmetsp:Transcript_7560/g.10841  ORF Transcript_7560/g.10841 Transcript_7560/m.10841 type:complete len:95 (+) Transcript_7560:103-387(+)|eukprot:CAMPEP_0184862826 /NCGR_PEP_ID=MMETSP0580-20130426/7997_1 /TAXON_ID=1118495 /ORGANISM="Dactyliosolen fragilissimus" /LENGTH=94 /DNA_ID=CAMNT_0027360831 /DNA_START=91 /DNA_END=375 /DNA_ORIENTATION=-
MMQFLATRATRTAVQLQQKRSMGGGPYPYALNVRKNKFVEEWNGRREITEKSFDADGSTIPWILTLCVAIPYAFYAVSKDELSKTGGRRYKKMC